MHDMIGKLVGDYEILEAIGEGGAGKVFLARNVHLRDMRVVLKFLKDIAQKDRFQREAATLCQLDHTNIRQIRHFFHFNEDLILVLQYINGTELVSVAQQRGNSDLKWIRDVFVQVLDGLAYAHGKQIYHRDMKPSNILIDINGVAKIIDFGIAKRFEDAHLTMTGMLVGTPRYMAPEQFTQNVVEDYSLCDIYSTGISIYELSCGRPPFIDTNPYVLKEHHCNSTPELPSKLNLAVTREFEAIILKSMAKDPTDRFESAAEMRDALRELRFGDTTEFVRVQQPLKKRSKKSLIIVLLLVIVAATSYWRKDPISQWISNLPFVANPRLSIPPQTASEGEAFTPIDLNSLLGEEISSGQPRWISSDAKHLLVAISDSAIASLGVRDSEWSGSDSVLFTAIFADGRSKSAYAQFKVTEVNDPPTLSQVPTQRISKGKFFAPIALDDFVEDPDDRDADILWSYTDSGNVKLSVNANRELIAVQSPDWVGSEEIRITATDPHGASADAIARFVVTAAKVPRARASLTVRVTPADSSRLLLDGRPCRPNTKYDVSPGEHTILVVHPDYPILQRYVSVSDQGSSLDVDLTAEYSGKENVDYTVAIFPPLDGYGLKLSMNDRASLYSNFPVLGLKLIPGRYLIGAEIVDANSGSSSGARVDSCVVNPFGGGPLFRLSGSTGQVLMATGGTTSEVRLIVYWTTD